MFPFLFFQRVIFQCTYPGCREEKTDVASIEAHVRMCHLNREADDQFDDGEEEFYYTEVEVAPPPPPRVRSYSHSVVFDLSLADHLDMARPPHEDPGLATRTIAIPSRPAAKVRSFSGGNRFNNSLLTTSQHQQQQQQQHPLTMPITIAPSAVSLMFPRVSILSTFYVQFFVRTLFWQLFLCVHKTR